MAGNKPHFLPFICHSGVIHYILTLSFRLWKFLPMTSHLIIAMLAAGLTSFAQPEASLRYPVVMSAGNCGAAAAKAVEQTGGQLLSAQPSSDGQSCIVTVLVQGNGERPRKVTMRIPM
jgi:hypothetical protein